MHNINGDDSPAVQNNEFVFPLSLGIEIKEIQMAAYWRIRAFSRHKRAEYSKRVPPYEIYEPVT